jgi:integrase
MRGCILRRGVNSWRLQIELERIGGKRNRRLVMVKGSRKDAERELAKLLTQADAGTLADPSKDTVAVYLERYLDNALHLSPKTLERYRELAARQIIPHLGDVKLQKLRAEHIEAWHAALLATGLSPRTVGHAHRLLSSVLRRAVENGSLSRNVAAHRRPPAAEAGEVPILTPSQAMAALEALKGHGLYPIAYLALQTGMRRGELAALEWRDLDLERGVLRVERSLEETRAGLRTKPPKTKRGRRNISLPAEAVAMLREHRKAQIELRLALGQGGQPSLVFSTIEGEHLSPDNLSRDWRRVCRQKKLPLVSFHSLRHTHASTLIAAGVDPLTVSRRLGHAKVAMTLDVYGHLMEGSDAAAAKAIEGVLK